MPFQIANSTSSVLTVATGDSRYDARYGYGRFAMNSGAAATPIATGVAAVAFNSGTQAEGVYSAAFGEGTKAAELTLSER